MAFQWVPAENGHIPPGAVQGGHEADGKPLFVARCHHNGICSPGKLASHLGGIHVAYGNQEMPSSHYEVLVASAGVTPVWQWVQPGQQLVHGAGGFDHGNQPLWIARIMHEGGMCVGKAGNHLGIHIPWGNKEIEYRDRPYEVLLMMPYRWVPVQGGNIPHGAVQGGHEADGKPLFVGRVHHNGICSPGKAAAHLGGMHYAYGNNEVSASDYEVLVAEGGFQPVWHWVRPGEFPIGHCGGVDHGNQPLWVARIQHEGGVCIGKAGPHLGIHIAWGNREIEFRDRPYEILLL